MISRDFKKLLNSLGLLDNKAVFFFDKENGDTFVFPSKEIGKKLTIIKPTAFYVFNEQPFILFFDLVNYTDTEREKEIHKQVWSFDQSPIIFIVREGDIQIFNAFAYDKRIERLQEIKLKEKEERSEVFSFWNLQSGSTWAWLQANHYKSTVQKKRVNQKLFDNIQLVRAKLTNPALDNKLADDEANTLILRLIFIRYLLDRDVKLDNEYINGNNKTERRNAFIKLIERPRKLNEFFGILNERFNGVLFKDIRFQITKDQAKALADVFKGERPERGSLFYGDEFYFEIFDFSIIPVEIISGIYESLIDPETRELNSAVYTPSFLVEYILTNTIDKYFEKKENKNNAECKVFDPSLGSGIFLVQSYRRMIDREIDLTGGKVNKVRLREIAQQNLFGIDINEQALKVACFSIYIAMLDYIEPKSIMINFHFPTLIDENFFCANLFNTVHLFNRKIQDEKIDFILGNPPWKSNKDEEHVSWLKVNNKVTGRFEIAQSFLLRSKDFMCNETISALIVTSTIFYNVSATTKKFKMEFLTQFCVDSFFDLSPVRRLIFEEKNSPCAIVFYRLSDGNSHMSNVVKHQSVKSNSFLKYYKTLVIEKFDQKKIQQRYFIENDWMFKVALYGGVLDFFLLKRLAKNKIKIIDLVNNETIFKGAGIHKGTKEAHEPFPAILNKSVIENDEVERYYSCSHSSGVMGEEDIYIKSGRQEGLYQGIQILIKEQAKNESEIVVSLTDNEYVFRSGIFSISSTHRKSEVLEIYSYLITQLYEYYVFITSGSWGVSTRPQIRLDEEYLSFPYVKMNDKSRNKLMELVNQFIAPFRQFYETPQLGAISPNELILKNINLIIEELYQIKEYEKDIINYVLDVSRYQFQEGKQVKIIRKVHNDMLVLKKYANVFLNEFESIYKGEYLQIKVYPLSHFIAMNFSFFPDKPEENIFIVNDVTRESEVFDIIAKNISIFQITKDLYTQKDIKGFEQNSFYIIKPNEYKCWHRAMAWYDVSEIKDAIQSAELDRLKNSFDNAIH